MRKHYYLFLDETCANANLPAFCLAGCIIEKKQYEEAIIPQLQTLKRNVFGSEGVILHEMVLRKPSPSKNPEYAALKDERKRDQFWRGMESIFQQGLTFMGAVVKTNDCYSFYPESGRMNHFSICLQIILENFTHFLACHDATGSLFLEARGPELDQAMQDRFHVLKAVGTLFLSNRCIQRHVATISFPLKKDNNTGLQLADFCPNSIARHILNRPQKKPSLLKHILDNQYDGNVSLPERFGIKIM